MTCTIVSNRNEQNWKCKNEHEMQYIVLKMAILNCIYEMYQKGYTEYYLNCENGIPLWTAEIICALKIYNQISLHLVIPYEEQSANRHEEIRDRYYQIHEKSDSVKYASFKYHPDCYDAADRIMIDKSDAVIAFRTLQEKNICGKICPKDWKNCLYYSNTINAKRLPTQKTWGGVQFTYHQPSTITTSFTSPSSAALI